MTVDDIADQLAVSCTKGSHSLMGCSEAEISRLESKFDVTLPKSYRRFLERMGHHAGGLGEQPTELLYPAVLLHTQRVRELIDRCNGRLKADYKFKQRAGLVQRFFHRVGIYREPETPTLNLYDFPVDSLVIYMEKGLPEYWAIRCNNLNDSPVYRFDWEGDVVELRHRYDSVVDFLSSMLQQRVADQQGR